MSQNSIKIQVGSKQRWCTAVSIEKERCGGEE